jgi:hypothetical protein
MKSTLTFCFAAALLCGCAGPEYWDHGEWLDHVSVRPAKVVPHTPEEQQALQVEADQLHAQAEAIRVRMANDKNRDRRIDDLNQLESIGDWQRVVLKAQQGGPMPYRGQPIAPPGDAGGDGG